LWLLTEVALADVEILGRVERRRKWTAQEKAALLAEVEAEGGKVTIVARRHRISESVLYNWRAAWKAAAAVMQAPVAAPFIPLGVLGGSSHRDAAMLAPPEPEPPEPGTPRPPRVLARPCGPAAAELAGSRSCCQTVPASASMPSWTRRR
jgi:hypothetical protein